jgi:hypothetical protein
MKIDFTNYTNMLTEAELLLLCEVFAWKMPHRNRFWLWTILSALFAIGIAFPVRSIDLGNPVLSGTVNYFILFCLEILVLFSGYRLKFVSDLFLAIVAYTIRHLTYLVWETLLTITLQYLPDFTTGFSWLWVVYAILAFLTVLPFTLILIRRAWLYPEIVLPSASIIALASASLIINNLLNMFLLNSEVPESLIALKYIIFIFNMLSSVMILFIMFSLVHEKKLENEVVAINQMRHEEEKQYALSKETIDLINIKCHDLRHQIRALQTSHSTISPEEIKSIEDATRIYDTRIKTGNPSLDIILQEKALLCNEHGILFSCITDGSALNFITESDIYALFGNILDNAIESVLRLPEEKRSITLKIKKAPGGAFAYEENPYLGDLKFRDGLPVSTKNDDRYHGFGMKSIRAIVLHYEGTMDIKAEEGLFRLSILFPDPKA